MYLTSVLRLIMHNPHSIFILIEAHNMELVAKYQDSRPCDYRHKYCFYMFSINKSKKEGKDQESIQITVGYFASSLIACRWV